MSFIVAITDYVFPSLEPERAVLESLGVELRPQQCRSEEEIIALAQDADAVLNCYAKMTARVIENLKRCRIIARYGIGVDNVDLPAATRAGIVVSLAPGRNSTAELAVGLMLAVMRRIPQSDRAMRNGEWPLVLGYVLKGKTLGILGLGKIGTEVAAIGRAFGMKVIAWGPTLTRERAAKSQATFMPLDDVLRTADVVSVHLKLSEQSKGLIDERRLHLMKKSAYFVNTARGAIVDEQALVRVLADNAIAGAALDVFVEEPLPAKHPILELDNVILTPHLGWPTDSGFEGFAENAVANILEYMDGKLTRALNPEALQHRAKAG